MNHMNLMNNMGERGRGSHKGHKDTQRKKGGGMERERRLR